MVVVGITLLIGIMYIMYSSSTSRLARITSRQAEERALFDYCVSFPRTEVEATNKHIGELLSLYNSTGNEIYIFEGKYVLNITSKLETIFTDSFGRNWWFKFGAMEIGNKPPNYALGCKIFVPSIDSGKSIYAVLKVW